ncbi:MAG: transcription antitermination factor NusB [Bacteroidales bacterium]
MINRWIIRNKVLHILYANKVSSETSINKAEKELFFSIDKLVELAHLLVTMPVAFKDEAQRRIDQGKAKRIPGHSDLNPNTNFIDNKIIEIIENDCAINAYLSKNHIRWESYDNLLKDLFSRLTEWPRYNEYLEKKNPSLKEQSRFIEKIFTSFLSTQEDLIDVLEEKDIYWNDDLEFSLSIIGSNIKRLKKATDMTGVSPILPPIKSSEQKFAKELFRSAVIYNDRISQIIEKHVLNWEMERLALIDLIILQLALAEILYIDGIPVNVSINEYIEISKHYSSAKSSNFINGILDNAAKALQKSGDLDKI